MAPTPVFLLEESHGQRRLVGYSPYLGARRVRHDWNDWTCTPICREWGFSKGLLEVAGSWRRRKVDVFFCIGLGQKLRGGEEGRGGEAEVWGWREKVVCQPHPQPLCCQNHPWLAQFWCNSTLLLAKILKLVNMCSRIRWNILPVG